jgi:hypothetical protein
MRLAALEDVWGFCLRQISLDLICVDSNLPFSLSEMVNTPMRWSFRGIAWWFPACLIQQVLPNSNERGMRMAPRFQVVRVLAVRRCVGVFLYRCWGFRIDQWTFRKTRKLVLSVEGTPGQNSGRAGSRAKPKKPEAKMLSPNPARLDCQAYKSSPNLARIGKSPTQPKPYLDHGKCRPKPNPAWRSG